jgi:hypothetical protein
VLAVVGDRFPLPDQRPADLGQGHAADAHAVQGVADVREAVAIEPDVVAKDLGAGGADVVDQHAVIVVAGDDVLRRVRRTPDQVVGRLDAQAVFAVAPVYGAPGSVSMKLPSTVVEALFITTPCCRSG